MPYKTNSVQSTADGRYRTSSSTISSKTYTANGALTPGVGTHLLAKTSAGAFTIAAPKASDDGKVVRIVATTAYAHTVTFATTGFNGAGTGGDVATFGGAAGDSMTLVAAGTKWYTTNLRNVTLG